MLLPPFPFPVRGELKGVSPSSSSSNFGPVTNRNHSTLFPFFSSGLHCAILTGVKTAGDRRRRYKKGETFTVRPLSFPTQYFPG